MLDRQMADRFHRLEQIRQQIGTQSADSETWVREVLRKLAALTAHQEHVAEQTQTFTAGTQQEISGLQAEIEKKRKEIETAGLELR